MPKKKQRPQIRFKGFADDWEKHNVSDVSDRYDNLRVPVAENLRIKGTTPYYGANGIQDYVDGYTHDGEFILVAEDGANDLKNYPVNYVNGQVWVNNHAHVLQAKKSLADNRFLGYSISIADIESALVGGSRAKLNANVLMNIPILLPEKDEQIRISSFISSLDKLITLHQRKYEKLLNMKKSCLEKMFPKNENKNPEIRFKGFSDTWESQKLGEACKDFTDGDWIEAKDQSENGIRLIQTGNIGITNFIEKENKKWITEETFNRLHCTEVCPGDILISRLPEPAGRACIVPNLGYKMITAVDCTIVKNDKKLNNKFLVQFLSTAKYFNTVNDFLAGGTRQRITKNNLSKFDILTPKLKEQIKIGKFFEQLDNLITLHQRKLKMLQNIKKSCLEKMFV